MKLKPLGRLATIDDILKEVELRKQLDYELPEEARQKIKTDVDKLRYLREKSILHIVSNT